MWGGWFNLGLLCTADDVYIMRQQAARSHSAFFFYIGLNGNLEGMEETWENGSDGKIRSLR